MNEPKIKPVKGLHLEIENGKPVLKNRVDDVEVTVVFAETEPARNCKEACLSIITSQYCDHLAFGETRT